MEKSFGALNWREYIPMPILDEHPEYLELYNKAWELAFEHIKNIPGMPQNPYMDEAFCDTQIWIWDTCFMSLFCKYASAVFPGIESFKNLYTVLYDGTTLPSVIPTEYEPDWTGATPGEPFNIHLHIADNPPLFAWAEYENALMSGDAEHIRKLLYEDRFLQNHYEWIESLKKPLQLKNVRCSTFLISEKYGYKWEGALREWITHREEEPAGAPVSSARITLICIGLTLYANRLYRQILLQSFMQYWAILITKTYGKKNLKKKSPS